MDEPTNTTRAESPMARTILDAYTLRLEEEVVDLRRRRAFWERCFWAMTALALVAVAQSILLLRAGP